MNPLANAKTSDWKLPAIAGTTALLAHVIALALVIASDFAAPTTPADPGSIAVGDVVLMQFQRSAEDCDFQPMQPEPIAAPFVVENRLPVEIFRDFIPDEKKLNALLDMEEGGTELRPEGKRSGGGGGDGADALIEGHLRTDERIWARLKLKPDPNAKRVTDGDEAGRGQSVPGILKSPGAGSGLGNGAGSGALASLGTGSGAGAGANGSNSGNGMGTAPALGLTRKPAVLSMNHGAYPDAARAARHEGTVTMDIEILEDGTVGTIHVSKSSGFDELDRSAVTAAKDWRFTGALLEGKPVRFKYRIPYNFVLANY